MSDDKCCLILILWQRLWINDDTKRKHDLFILMLFSQTLTVTPNHKSGVKSIHLIDKGKLSHKWHITREMRATVINKSEQLMFCTMTWKPSEFPVANQIRFYLNFIDFSFYRFFLAKQWLSHGFKREIEKGGDGERRKKRWGGRKQGWRVRTRWERGGKGDDWERR